MIRKMFSLLAALVAFTAFSVAGAAGNYIYYLDAEGTEFYEQKDLDKLMSQIQEKMPSGSKLSFDSAFYTHMENLRINRQETLMNHLKRNYPEFENLSGLTECKLTAGILAEGLFGYDYDGVVVLKIVPRSTELNMLSVKDKTGKNDLEKAANYAFKILGKGGIKTDVDMEVSIMVFDASTQKYVFSHSELMQEQISGTWSPITASKKVVPLILKKIDSVPLE